MRAGAALLTVAMIVAAPAVGQAQGRLRLDSIRVLPAPPSSPAGPVVAVAPVTIDDEESIVAIQRAADRIAERLRPIEDRVRDDERLRRAGAVIGLGALAIGAVRGTRPLTFAGTQALRVGLHNQLAAIRQRSGFVVEPSIGHRSFSVTLSRKFD